MPDKGTIKLFGKDYTDPGIRVGKSKTWLAMILSLGVSMLLFMMIPSISPLNSTIINVILSLAGGTIFAFVLGWISNVILSKTSLV